MRAAQRESDGLLCVIAYSLVILTIVGWIGAMAALLTIAPAEPAWPTIITSAGALVGLVSAAVIFALAQPRRPSQESLRTAGVRVAMPTTADSR